LHASKHSNSLYNGKTILQVFELSGSDNRVVKGLLLSKFNMALISIDPDPGKARVAVVRDSSVKLVVTELLEAWGAWSERSWNECFLSG
jgi:hypothetical protein